MGTCCDGNNARIKLKIRVRKQGGMRYTNRVANVQSAWVAYLNAKKKKQNDTI